MDVSWTHQSHKWHDAIAAQGTADSFRGHALEFDECVCLFFLAASVSVVVFSIFQDVFQEQLDVRPAQSRDFLQNRMVGRVWHIAYPSHFYKQMRRNGDSFIWLLVGRPQSLRLLMFKYRSCSLWVASTK